ITIDIPPPFLDSPQFFRLTLGSYKVAPRMLGQPDALVDMKIEPRRVTYDITPPPDLTIFARARRMVGAALGSRRAVEELSAQQSEIGEASDALARSRSDLQRIIDALPDAVVIHRGGTIIYSNPAFAHCLGFDRTSSLAGTRLVDHAINDDRARVERWAQ